MMNAQLRGKSRVKMLMVWSFAATVGFCALHAHAAPAKDPSLDKTLESFEAPWGQELWYLCRSLNRPCGEETTAHNDYQNRSVKNRPRFQLKKASVSKALDEMAARYPGHRWEERNEVLNFEPKSRTNSNLLSRRLDRVSLHGIPSKMAAYRILEQAKIRLPAISSDGPEYFAAIDLELENVTVREALNAIAKADGQVVWSFHEIDERKGEGGFTMSTWRKSGGMSMSDYLRKSGVKVKTPER